MKSHFNEFRPLHFLIILATIVSCTMEIERPIDASILGEHLDYLMNETLGVEKMQKRINILDFKRERYNGESLVKKLSEIISTKISQHIEGLRKTKQILKVEVNSRKHKKSSKSIWTSCCRYPEENTVFDKGFNTKVDATEICELVSETTPLQYYALPRAVLEQMQKNHEDMPFLKWQYVGSNQGVFFTYPAHRRPELCMGTRFDPRFRPWFVEAASPEKKNVLILLDSSNSMSRTHNSRRLLDVAVDAIETLLDSLTPNDKVGIVAFNDSVFYPNDCFRKQLGFADTINKKKLKEQFLNRLKPGGQSHYAEAFRSAFELVLEAKATKKVQHARPRLQDPLHCVILFISDGDASEIYHDKVNNIYQAIREGNRNILNHGTIYSYGLGRKVNLTLLEKISEQNFDDVLGEDNITTMYGMKLYNISKGTAYRIKEPSQLRNELSFFYTNLINNATAEAEENPSFSVPYVDSGGLGLIFTAGFPVFGRNEKGNFLAAVVAVDISIADLFGDVIKLKNDDRSYVFVIDGSGRVLTHPLLPVPDDDTNAPSFIHIEALERDASLKEVIKSMIEGKQGQKTILSSRVAPAGDCNKVFIVNQTYHWHPIANTNFSLCFVEEETDYLVTLSPHLSVYGCLDNEGNPVVAHQCENMTVSNFRYHRLDLTASRDICRHFYQMSTVESSVVKLAPQCFVDVATYEQKSETVEKVTAYEAIFNELLRVTSSEEAEQVMHRHIANQPVCEVIRDDVISDIVWTSCADSLWLKNAENHVIRRYIGTRTGMVRFYPGTNISASYDPVKRDWYELALAHPGLRVFSPPYKDAAGAGNVITISHTVHTPRISHTKENQGVTEEKVIGVMGVDLSLNSFYAKIVDLYPKCEKEWHCSIVDVRGYFVVHKGYTEAEAPERKHLTGDEGPLSQILLDRGLMFRARCLELENTKYKVSYVILHDAYLNEMDSSDRCKRYYLEAIPNSNAFFVAREYHSTCYYQTCVLNNKLCHEHEECVNHDNWSNTTCECPCRTDLIINSCVSFIDAQIDIVACYPFRDRGEAVKNECLPASLPPCYDPQCDRMTSHMNCSSIVGCTWCGKSSTGGTLEKPYCSETDLCYDGFEGHRLPGFGLEQKICDKATDMDEKIFIIIAVSGGLFVFIVVMIICVCHCVGKMNKIEKSIKNDESKASRSLSDIDHDVATIAAAIGAREISYKRPGNSSQSNSSGGRRDHRRSSTSSQSSTRQKSVSSPQVVLSIVDSDGEEIARSLPRPVQIVRGSQSANKDSVEMSSVVEDRQARTKSTASIVLGSAGESSGLSSSGDTKTNQPCLKRRPKMVGVSNSCSTEGSAETVIRKRNYSSSGATGKPEKERRPRSEPVSSDEANNAETRRRSSSEERPQAKSITNVLRSVLKKRRQSKKDTYPDRSLSVLELPNEITPQDIEPGTPYYNMFAEPTSHEGDIPIIQSDHSDAESVEHGRFRAGTSDYISMCSDFGEVSSGSWVANPRQHNDRWRNIDVVSDHDDDDDGIHDVTLHKAEEVFCDDEINVDAVDELAVEFPTSAKAVRIESPQVIETSNIDNAISVNGIIQKTRKRDRRKPTRVRDPSDRVKNIKTENFIVYV